MKKIIFSTLLAAMLPQLAEAAPKNIIYMIGDGMGPAYLSAYRYYQDDPATKAVETTIYDELWIGIASTYPDDDTIVTDSAAGATALATRIKSYNGAISVNHQHQSLTTMLEIAKAKGMHTGIVATSQINHATPASFMAHDKHRKNYNEIADDFVDNKVAGQFVGDLMFGGGTTYFIRNDRNLVNEFKQAGFSYADNWQDLQKLSKLPAMALLAPVGLPSALDNPVANPLQTMTEKALQLLTPSEKGFVLMVEGSQIDWCGHANDIACAMAEMADFAKAIKVAKDYVDSHPDTMLVVTADHETGGLSLGSEGEYAWNTKVIQGVKHTAAEISRQLLASTAGEVPVLWKSLTGIQLEDQELKTLQLALQQAQQAVGPKPLTSLEGLTKAQEKALETLHAAVKRPINHHSKTGWTSGAHTAIDVPVLAWGKQRGDFAGFQDNTDIAAKLIGYIEAK